MIEEDMQVELQLNGRETVEGDDAEAIVAAMVAYQWPDDQKTATPAEYMVAVNERLKTQGKPAARNCCAEHFLDDLAAAGVIRRLP